MYIWKLLFRNEDLSYHHEFTITWWQQSLTRKTINNSMTIWSLPSYIDKNIAVMVKPIVQKVQIQLNHRREWIVGSWESPSSNSPNIIINSWRFMLLPSWYTLYISYTRNSNLAFIIHGIWRWKMCHVENLVIKPNSQSNTKTSSNNDEIEA